MIYRLTDFYHVEDIIICLFVVLKLFETIDELDQILFDMLNWNSHS
jgi:hypothetical protein